MNRFQTAAATFGLLSISLAPAVRADSFNRETVMTIDQPVQVQGILLEPGEHVFRLALRNSDHTIVSIYNADKSQLEGVLIGLPAYRLNIDDQLFTVSQPDGNQPAQLRDWYFAGGNNGIEFRQAAKAGAVAGKSKHDHPSASPSETSTH